ncbi:MAG: hypothetical protein ACYC96_05215 [Fimbriimonadaceae bacterium]
MLDALKQLVGLAPRDRREVWRDKPLVIVTSDDSVLFSGTATIEYTPSTEAYEVGEARVFDEYTGALILRAKITRQRVYSSIDQSNPYRLRWARLGLTAKAVDDANRSYTLFVGRHAQTYLLRRRGSLLDYTADTATIPYGDDAVGEPDA